LRFLASLLVLAVIQVVASVAEAVPQEDPPLTYVFTVYDRDRTRLARDGGRVEVWPLLPSHTDIPRAEKPCGVGIVNGGLTEVRVEFSASCPVNVPVYLLLTLRGGGAPTVGEIGESILWRLAYSDATATRRLSVKPVPPSRFDVPPS